MLRNVLTTGKLRAALQRRIVQVQGKADVLPIARVVARGLAATKEVGQPAKLEQSKPVGLSQARDDQSTESGGRGALWGSFVACVLLPSAAAFLYFFFWASDIYTAEAKMAVRAQEESASIAPALGAFFEKMGLSRGSMLSTNQDAFIVLNYVKSRAVIADIGGREFLEKFYSLPEIDWFSRMRKKKSIEDVWEYWRRHVSANIDTASGILTLRAQAYRPSDARAVAAAVLEQSELLINQISERMRQDAVSVAEHEMTRARDRLATARANTAEFRNRTGLIDPVLVATSLGEIISKLTIEKIELENSLASLANFAVGDGSSARQLRSRVEAIERKISELNSQMTDESRENTISQNLKEYENLILNEKFLEKIYSISSNIYESARNSASRKSMYLVVIVKPSLPEKAVLPIPWLYTLVAFAVSFVLWSIMALTVAAIRDHTV